MESSIYSLVKINIANLVQNEAVLLKNYYTPISEIERLPYWQYEMLMSEIEKLVKDENERNKEQEGSVSQNQMMRQYSNSMSQMTRNMRSSGMPSGMSMPKMPKI